MDKSICKLIIWPKYLQLITQSFSHPPVIVSGLDSRNACPECLGHTLTKPLYQVCCQLIGCIINLICCFEIFFSLCSKIGMESIWVSLRFMAFGKGEQSPVKITVAAPVSGNEWSAPGADISPCQGQLLPLVWGAPARTRGQQLDVTTGQMKPMMMMILCRWEQILKMDFALGFVYFSKVASNFYSF